MSEDERARRQPIDRRTFMRRGALSAAFAAAGADLLRAAGTDAGAESPALPAADLEEATISALQGRMESGSLTSRSLTQACLDRIEALDRKGPTLREVLETNPDALAIAEALDAERRAKGSRGPLHGIPILLKDNIDTADRMTTTAGSHALAGSIAPKDSFVAQKLREAGAVLLGKANLSEWANFRSTQSSSGWSGRGGQARNPYALDRNPCGSSSGSAAAVSANYCPVAIGTETDGSIMCPSSTCGIVGIKPTLGLVSRAGIIPIAHSQDTAGPMARTVADAALLLAALTGADPRDPETAESVGHALADYTKSLDPQGLSGARIGVARKFFGFNERVDRLMEDALAEMKRRGAVVVDPTDIPTADQLDDGELDVLLYEFKADLNAYLRALGPKAPVHSLDDVIAYNDAHREQEMPLFGQDLLLKASQKGPLTTPAYVQALANNRRLARAEGIDAIMDANRLDALVAPTGGPAWVTDPVNGDHFSGGSSSPAAVAGYPAITVPAGFVFGLPVGITFMGRAWTEPMLIKLAYAFEQATHLRRPPRFLATADLAATTT